MITLTALVGISSGMASAGPAAIGTTETKAMKPDLLSPPPPPAPLLPVPSESQLAWQRLEMTMFLHFGVNTFTDQEWGDGTENPDIFNPERLDCKQWVRAAKEAGFGMMILTAKHHDGFCLWPSAHTEYSVKNSAWRGGEGDVMREFVDACRAEEMNVGFYLSPWDRHDTRYGGEAYNAYFKNQLSELMSTYGPIDEVWFDGASKGKITPYDWEGFYRTIYNVNPDAVIAIMGPDIRWVGNESGVAREGESSVQDALPERHFGKTGKVWYPAECDVSIRPGWFYHADQDGKVKSVEHLLDIYFKSVGRNSELLLNVPPDRDGRFADADVARLRDFRAALDEIFAEDVTAGSWARATNTRGQDSTYAAARVLDGDLDTYWATDDGVTQAMFEVRFPEARSLNVVDIQEAIFLGERVRRYHVEAGVDGEWQTIGKGTIIGHRNLLRTRQVETDRLRLVIDEAAASPAICRFAAYLNPRAGQVGSGSLAAHNPVRASDVHPGGTQYGGDKAVDDDPETRWATSDDVRECWLEVDLRKPKTFSRIRIRELTPRITRYQVEYREAPDEVWQVAHEGDGAGTDHHATFAPVTARYIRLHILDATSAPSIWEFGFE